MPTTFTPTLNLTKPLVGGDKDIWGQYWNDNADKTDAVFRSASRTEVSLTVGASQTLEVKGDMLVKDSTDPTKVFRLRVDNLPTATTRTVRVPYNDGTLVTEEQVLARMPTGTVLSGYYGNTAPIGFVLADGRTIGDASSTATNRANADCERLFKQLWALNFTVVGGRGATAQLDWDGHKQLTLPNHSGRVMAGRDNLSGTAAGVLPGYTAVGTVGGAQSTSTTVSATGNASVNGTTGAVTAGQSTLVAAGTNAGPVGLEFHSHSMSFNAPVSVNGGTAAFGIVQPTIAVDVIIAL